MRLKRLLPLAIVLLGGLFLWRTGAFGLFPTDRTLVWRLPVSYGEVRGLELQVWHDGELLKREEQRFEAGLVGEPSVKLPLAAGVHRAVATVRLHGRGEPLGFSKDFDPGDGEAVVLEWKR